mgnify:CR=1 FL=1
MNREKFLILIVTILTCLNIALVLHTLLVEKPGMLTVRQEGIRGPKELIIERLRFNKDQVKKYDELIKEHQHNVSQKEADIRKLRARLFSGLGAGDDFDKNIAAEIGDLQQQLELIHVKHFLGIKKLCTPEQVVYFNEMTDELAHLFAPGPKGRSAMPPPRP